MSTKGTGVHVFTFMEKSKIKTFVCGRMKVYDKYGRYELQTYTGKGTDVVVKVRKGISYADALHQSS